MGGYNVKVCKIENKYYIDYSRRELEKKIGRAHV